jgi:hypothetical protein
MAERDDQCVWDRPNRTEAIEKTNSAARRHPSADGSSANTTLMSSTKSLGKSSLNTSLGAKSRVVVGLEKRTPKKAFITFIGTISPFIIAGGSPKVPVVAIKDLNPIIDEVKQVFSL